MIHCDYCGIAFDDLDQPVEYDPNEATRIVKSKIGQDVRDAGWVYFVSAAGALVLLCGKCRPIARPVREAK